MLKSASIFAAHCDGKIKFKVSVSHKKHLLILKIFPETLQESLMKAACDPTNCSESRL